jgi:VanZ family protein
LFAFAASTLYAITDEFHQSFVPNRQGHLADVLIDSSGAALGLAGIWLFSRWRNRRPKNHHRAPSGR